MTILVIDIGSSSVRALLFDQEAHLIPDALARQKHEISTDAQGAAYFDVKSIQTLVEACLDQILAHPAAKDIQAVSMDTFAGNIMGLDESGEPITPLLTYAESRPTPDLRTLRSVYEATDTHQRTGCPHHTAYLPAQLHWLRRTQPSLFDQVVKWTDLGSFLYQQWFGKDLAMSYSIASWSGLLNRQTLDWDTIWLSALGLIPTQFPSLTDYAPPLRGLKNAYHRRWQALANAPFYHALGDGAMANVGVGAVGLPNVALTVGTTAALRIITPKENPTVPQGLWSYRVDAGHHLIGGATSEGGNVYQWVQRNFNVPSDAEAQIQTRPADQHGLTFLPLLAGERSPGWSADASAIITGLRIDTSPVDILQAALESVAMRLAQILEALPLDKTLPKIIANGGALVQSKVWAQIMANAFGAPIYLPNLAETTARGTAIMALSDLQNMFIESYDVPNARIISPNDQQHRRLKAAQERQAALYIQHFR